MEKQSAAAQRITWAKIGEAGIDVDRVTRTPDGIWHVMDDGQYVVHFGIEVADDGTQSIEVFGEIHQEQDSFALDQVAQALEAVARLCTSQG